MKLFGTCAILALLCGLGWYAKVANLKQRAIACDSTFLTADVATYPALNDFVAQCEFERSVLSDDEKADLDLHRRRVKTQ